MRTFCDEEIGFTIAGVKVKGEKDLVMVAGDLPGGTPGEVLDLLGEWNKHPKFETQFKAVKFKSIVSMLGGESLLNLDVGAS